MSTPIGQTRSYRCTHCATPVDVAEVAGEHPNVVRIEHTNALRGGACPGVFQLQKIPATTPDAQDDSVCEHLHQIRNLAIGRPPFHNMQAKDEREQRLYDALAFRFMLILRRADAALAQLEGP